MACDYGRGALPILQGSRAPQGPKDSLMALSKSSPGLHCPSAGTTDFSTSSRGWAVSLALVSLLLFKAQERTVASLGHQKQLTKEAAHEQIPGDTILV